MPGNQTSGADDIDHADDMVALVSQLTLNQKVSLVTGADVWSLHAIDQIGLQPLVFADGPAGVRGPRWDERDPSTNLPSGTALAATWDRELAFRYGHVLAREARRKGVHVVLGPTINLQRSPLGGRHFEAFSEDPHLTAELAIGYIRGLQTNGIAACPKHYVANDFETDRFTASVELGDRALRELYLAPFERAVTEAGAWTLMSSYNSVRGVTMSENDLLRDPLMSEWGFDGVVVSDWSAVKSLDAARAEQHVSMPGPDGPWGSALIEAIESGEVPVKVIDSKVERILRLAARVGALGEARGADARPLDERQMATASDDARVGGALARKVQTRGTVLVRNTGILPLDGLRTPRSVALIGQSMITPRTQGGGSATVVPERIVSPLEGIRRVWPDAEIITALGSLTQDALTGFTLESIRDPQTGAPGARLRFLDRAGCVTYSELRNGTEIVWLRDAPVAGAQDVELSFDFTPRDGGPVEIGIETRGQGSIELDGALLVEQHDPAFGQGYGGALPPLTMSTGEVDLHEGRAYRFTYRHRINPPFRKADGRYIEGVVALTAGWRPVRRPAGDLLAEAEDAAGRCEVAVVVVGTDSRVESEGFDRTSLSLPGNQDELVAAVIAANPRTVVVVNAGAPVLMPWRDDAAAVLLTWFGGQEYGNALADILSGAAEPGGRLPSTWPADHESVPVLSSKPIDGQVHYSEGIHMGYRAWDRAGAVPAYPFGYGLGYTSWSFDDVAISIEPEAEALVSLRVRLTNTGLRRGRQVAQVYLTREDSAVERPARWLAGFAGVTLSVGESGDVQVAVRRRAFEHWDEDNRTWVLEPGLYGVLIGPDSVTTALRASVNVP